MEYSILAYLFMVGRAWKQLLFPKVESSQAFVPVEPEPEPEIEYEGTWPGYL